MKRILTLLLLLVIGTQLSAQLSVQDRRPLWVGLDMGGTWQTSDMKSVGGIGWSFTLSRYSRLSKPGLLYYGWRFRFMDGRNYGYNYHALTSISNNPVLSSGATNYATGAPNPSANGYVFSNYKMHFDEFALELIVGSNTLRKHGVLLYGFGGAGLNYWNTKTDQLQGFSGTDMYNYASIDQSAGQASVRNELDLMWDGEYETNANPGGARWSFMPSAGFGMGYQWGNGVAIGVEHRTTFALNDIIDGVSHDHLGNATNPKNDQYHYDGFFVRWTFGGNSESHTTNNNPPPPPPTYTQNPPPNNPPVVTNPPQNNPPQNNPPQNNPPQQTIYPPAVRFTTPSVEPYTTNVQNQQLVVRVDNVNYSSQIQLLINNQASTNFSFNPNTNTMAFTHTLMPGTNVYQVNASNQAGSASDVQTIIYNNPNNNNPPVAVPPQVTITNPPTDPYTSAVQTMTVNATVLNVNSASNIQIRRNSVAINNFSFDPNTHIVTFTANLQTGSNLYEVIGTNTVGSASDAVTINYNPAPVIQPPVVTITNPSVCPYTVKSAATTVTASITNVTMASQVTVLFNNQPVTNFNFTATQGGANISFQANLVAGNNPFTVTGTNTAGTNSKSCVIIYKVTTAPVPPVVTITNPINCPASAPASVTTVTASITNVTMANQVTVVFNNQPVTNFNFTTTSTGANISFQASLVNGNNPFTVTGTNAAGTDTKSCSINYNAPPVIQPPVVTITNPSSCPYTVKTSAYTVNASVTNVTAASQVTVVFNNQPVTNFTFTANSGGANISFPVTLVAGNNPFTVTGTNTAGTNSKSCVITYKVTTTPIPPSVTITNPATSPYASTTPNMQLTATVLNVAGQNEITVAFNNSNVTNFNYNSTTHVVTYNATLNTGNNVFTVSASNANGSDSKSATITYSQAQLVPPPVVNILTPSVNPLITNNAQENVIAEVLNIAFSNQITIKDQANQSVSFTFNANTHKVGFVANLTPGANVYTITATNVSGTASDNTTIKLVQSSSSSSTPPQGSGSGVSITPVNPSALTSSVTTASIPVSMKVTGVSGASEISVRVNNLNVTSKSYDANTQTLTFTANLNVGANTIAVSVQNNNGSDSKTLTVNYSTGRTSGGSGNSGKTDSGKSSGSGSGSSGRSSGSTTTPTKTETKTDSGSSTPKSGGSSSGSSSTPRGSSTTTTPKPR